MAMPVYLKKALVRHATNSGNKLLKNIFSFTCRISFIHDDGLPISQSVEWNNVFDYCGCFICNKNLLKVLWHINSEIKAVIDCDRLQWILHSIKNVCTWCFHGNIPSDTIISTR